MQRLDNLDRRITAPRTPSATPATRLHDGYTDISTVSLNIIRGERRDWAVPDRLHRQDRSSNAFRTPPN